MFSDYFPRPLSNLFFGNSPERVQALAQLEQKRPEIEQIALNGEYTRFHSIFAELKLAGTSAIAELLTDPYFSNGRSMLTAYHENTFLLSNFLDHTLSRYQPSCGKYDQHGETPLHAYVRWVEQQETIGSNPRPDKVVSQMIRLGAQPWERDLFGELPIMRVSRARCSDQYDFLTTLAQTATRSMCPPLSANEFKELVLRVIFMPHKRDLPKELAAEMNTWGKRYANTFYSEERAEIRFFLDQSISIAAKSAPVFLSNKEYADRLLMRIDSLPQALPQSWRKLLLNVPIHNFLTGDTNPLFVSIYQQSSNLEKTLARLNQHGINVETEIEISGSHGSLLHDPFILNSPNAVSLLLDKIPATKRDSKNRLPLEVAFSLSTPQARQSAALLLPRSDVTHLNNDERINMVRQAFQSGPAASILALLEDRPTDSLEVREQLADIREKRWSIQDYLLYKPRTLDLSTKALLEEIKKLEGLQSSPMVQVAAYKFGHENNNFAHTYYYLMASLEIEEQAPTKHGEYFNILLPHFIASKNPELVMPLVQLHDARTEGDKSSVHEAELIGLLSNPHLRHEHLEMITLSFTAPSLVYKDGIPKAKGTVLDAWRMAGVYAHDFIRYKWDTRQGLCMDDRGHWQTVKPLLEQFGFQRMNLHGAEKVGFYLAAGDRPWRTNSEQSFRNDRCLRDDATIFVLQAADFICIPNIGSFMVRNSSRVHGRDILGHVAGFTHLTLGNGYSEQDLLSDPIGILREFSPLHGKVALDHGVQNKRVINQFVEQLANFRREYSQWKFDTNRTTAFIQNEEGAWVMKGGFFSPGFAPMVRKLRIENTMRDSELIYKEHTKYDQQLLAFYRHDMPAWQPWSFSIKNKSYEYVLLNFDRLQLLEELIENPAESFQSPEFIKDMRRAGLFDFFQQAGFNRHADLTVVSVNEENLKNYNYI